MNVLTRLSSLVIQNAVAASVITGGSVVGLTLLGLVVKPATVLSITDKTDPDIEEFVSLSEARTSLVHALKRMIAASHAIIDVRDASAGAELVLWIDDKVDPGVVNENEILIISHAPLLQAAIALTRPPETGGEHAVDSKALFSDTLSTTWRKRPDVSQSIVTTDVTAMRVESIRRPDGNAALTVRLTFAPDNSDTNATSRSEAMFVVTLPAVSRSR